MFRRDPLLGAIVGRYTGKSHGDAVTWGQTPSRGDAVTWGHRQHCRLNENLSHSLGHSLTHVCVCYSPTEHLMGAWDLCPQQQT